MYRDWTLPLALIVGLAHTPLWASDEANKGDHAPAVYDAVFHDEQGKHVSASFDTSKPADREKLADLIKHGHVLELVNTTAPSLDKIFSMRADLGIWTLVIFGLLLLVLHKMAWPKMVSGLQRREQNIRGALDEAEKARGEAKALMADLDRERAQAADKVRAIIDQAKKDAQSTADDVLAKARTEITAERERLRREIQLETDQAMQGLWARAADLATRASAMALRRQIDGEQHRRLIDDALDELRKAAV